jgi:hypothetical protein
MTPALSMSAMLQPRDVMFVTQEARTALIWAAMNGHTEVVMALIQTGADVESKEKVRSTCCVNTGEKANDQRMLGTGLPDLGDTGSIEGCKCSMHCSCGLCRRD